MILTGLTKYRDAGLLILRLGFGIAFMLHGLPKLAGGPQMWAGVGSMANMPMPAAFGFLAALTEFGGGLLFALGLLFRPACIFLTINMTFALVLVHLRKGDAFAVYSHALEDAVVFFAFILIGPGAYSVDRK